MAKVCEPKSCFWFFIWWGRKFGVADCAGEHTLHGLSARRASYMELVRNFLVNEELSRYCWALLYKRKLKQSVKNKFFHPVLVTYGPLILYYYLT